MSLLGDEDEKYPKLGTNTKEEDPREATYVPGRTSTTRLDMYIYRSDKNEDDDVLENMALSDLVTNWYKKASIDFSGVEDHRRH